MVKINSVALYIMFYLLSEKIYILVARKYGNTIHIDYPVRLFTRRIIILFFLTADINNSMTIRTENMHVSMMP